jgi:hypothetical protein
MAMNVPPEMEGVHAAVLDATGDCYKAMDYLVSGLDNLSTDDLEMAGGLTAQCGEKLSVPTEMMEAYMAETEAPPAESPTEPPAPAGPTCDCSNDLYNCGDFGSQSLAQACFEYCQSIGQGDIHRLDGDNDGQVCE